MTYIPKDKSYLQLCWYEMQSLSNSPSSTVSYTLVWFTAMLKLQASGGIKIRARCFLSVLGISHNFYCVPLSSRDNDGVGNLCNCFRESFSILD